MSRFHTQQQSLCQLVSGIRKNEPLVEHAVLHHTEIIKLAHFLIFTSVDTIICTST